MIVGNPMHATVALDNPRLMIINAGVPGVTKLTVLGKNGRVIWSDRLIVNVGGGDYIRINNACINGGDECQSTKMLYCEDGEKCHSMMINTGDEGNNTGASAAEGGNIEEGGE